MQRYHLMRPAAQIQATIELLDQISIDSYPADRTMAQYFKQRRYIGSKDKAAISEGFYQILRNRLSYEYLLDEADLGTHSRLLAALNLCLDGKELSDYFNGEQYSPKPLRAEQLDAFKNITIENLESAPLNVQLNVPLWLEDKIQAAVGDRYTLEMQASNQRANTDIRVNTLKSSVEEVAYAITAANYNAEPTELSPWGLRFDGRVSLTALNAFKRGWFEIQDQGSQLLALLSDVKPGNKVVDFCAGAGGKTLAMAAMMENKGTLYACDVHSKRLEQLALRTKRAGVHNVRSHQLSSEHDKWVKKHREIADVVLLDVPCTGTGTWRRSPDSRWNLKPEDLDNLTALQSSIIQSAKRLVKPGGRLLYATCSLLREENEKVVEQFLADNDDFSPRDFALPNDLAAQSERYLLDGHQFRTLPALSETDGFFVASMTRD